MFKLLSRSTGVAGRSVSVIPGGRFMGIYSKSHFDPKSFTSYRFLKPFLNIFPKFQKEVLDKGHGHVM